MGYPFSKTHSKRETKQQTQTKKENDPTSEGYLYPGEGPVPSEELSGLHTLICQGLFPWDVVVAEEPCGWTGGRVTVRCPGPEGSLPPWSTLWFVVLKLWIVDGQHGKTKRCFNTKNASYFRCFLKVGSSDS